MKQLLTGNEAVARGAWEAGLSVASAYPGTPSTEILENLAPYKDIYAEWAPNEKVALEVASGASIAGVRALSTMKHVGLNVAADPLFTMAYIGSLGGLVVVSADDPGMFSSQNEQDNRLYAPHAHIPMIEPSNSQEAYEYVKLAFDISEKYDAPVLFRMTTRICHSKSVVEVGDRVERPALPYVKNVGKNVVIPANARVRKSILTKRLKELEEFSENTELNRVELASDGNKKIGIITSGVSYNHAREVFGDTASYLKLAFTYPLPPKKIADFASQFETIYVIEENEPYLENFVKQLGIKCHGKDLLPWEGELDSLIIAKAFGVSSDTENFAHGLELPPRPPVLCPGCPHRGVFYEVSKYKDIVVTGDIGCYTLGVVPPLSSIDTCICMGASVSAACGFAHAERFAKTGKKFLGVIGDSTFFHSGITGLINAVVNKAPIIVVILDNRITAMTGHQENPGTGKTLQGEETYQVDLLALCKACGVKDENIKEIDPYNIAETREAIRLAHDATEVFVIVAKQPCALIKSVMKSRAKMKCHVDQTKCIKCKMCMKAGCPALSFQDGQIVIDKTMCNGCEICAQICPKQAIVREE